MKNKQREIKFRFWDKKKKEMSDCEYLWFLDDQSINSIFRNEDYVFMQYTNLKDKNGVEIYEGDIIALMGADDEKDYFYEIYKAESGTWMGCNELYYDLKSKDFVKLEVVGNIYENSELLEDKK